MDSLLTILVPTWNRRKNLEQLLTTLVPQVRAHLEVDVIVSNNGSTDDTPEFLEKLRDEPRVHIIHQPVNLGPNIHLAWLYGQAKSQFLWMIGDDDLPEPDLVGCVVEELRDHPELGLLHLPGVYRFPNGLCVQTRCPERRETVRHGRELFAPYISWLGWTTANVVRTKPVQQNLIRVCFDTSWWPQFLMMEAVADLPAAVLPYRKLVGGAEITWKEHRDHIVIYQIPQAIISSRALRQREKTACLRQRYREQPGELLELIRFSLPLFLCVAARCPDVILSRNFALAAIRGIVRRRRVVKPSTPAGPS